ncbi:MAG: type II toxin-antitoxin system VapC family toxin [Deferrisomatales bacterium]|nr:type II toxin-antitoxin system VapC family toxin [Deferrisomatales bacterium]
MNSPLCVDASVVVRLLVDTPESARVHGLWEAWQAADRTLVAPTLLYYEVANALYRYEKAGELLGEEVQQALDTALALPVQRIGDNALHVEAALLARRIGLPATYDAHYLALAERLGAEFWTADRKLVRHLGAAFPWVRCAVDNP